MREPGGERGQTGIETLVVFIDIVLVATLAAGPLSNTADSLEQPSKTIAEDSQHMVTDRVTVLSVTGNDTTKESYVHNITTWRKASPSMELNRIKATVYVSDADSSRWSGIETAVVGFAFEPPLRDGTLTSCK